MPRFDDLKPFELLLLNLQTGEQFPVDNAEAFRDPDTTMVLLQCGEYFDANSFKAL